MLHYFRWQMSFLSSNRLLITNIWKHCVEEYKLNVNAITTYMGQCSSDSGSTFVGHRLDQVRLDRPYGVSFDGTGTLYVGLHYQALIISVNTATGVAEEFASTPALPRYLRYNSVQKNLFATLNNGFAVVQEDSVHYIVSQSNANQGDEVGVLTETRMYLPHAIFEAPGNVWIISDTHNERYEELNDKIWRVEVRTLPHCELHMEKQNMQSKLRFIISLQYLV